LELSGMPGQYSAGEVYRITVTLHRAALSRGGFQLAARFAAGRDRGKQAGQLLTSDDGRVAVSSTAKQRLQYAHHTPDGTFGARDSELSWSIEWRAPDSGNTPVVFHVAANASNDDDSEFGDFIYTVEREVTTANGRDSPEHQPL
jgi:hypothetical protein